MSLNVAASMPCRTPPGTRFAFASALVVAVLTGSDAKAADGGVPKVVGQPIRLARQLAEVSDFKMLVGTFYLAEGNWRDNIRPDVIGMQTPQPKSQAGTERIIAAWSFRKARPEQKIVIMPSLLGKSFGKATATLKALGLRTMDGEGILSDGDSAIRIVDEHYPRPGQPVVAGSSVFLNVATVVR